MISASACLTAHARLLPEVLVALACLHQALAADSPSFRNEVLPILSGHCFECHGFDPGTRFPKDQPLRLDVFEAATAARGDGKRAIAPGRPEASLLMHRVRSRDPDLVMPPPDVHKPLNAEQIETLERWIAAGAKYESHWAFDAPPREVSVPQTKDRDWPRNPIDSFILDRLERENIPPAPPAEPERWLRRVTYDLTGLPPAQPEIDVFLTDDSPSAKESVVDRLLASPRFGERMATPWLDVARYADSFGFQADIQTGAWPYRDWVVRAFNDNLPYDQFIIRQLAGDLLPDATRDQKLATAFNRIHRKTNEGGSVDEEFRQEGISDRIHTVGTAFMALTLECARCHDHKYDPISAKDYYSIGAFFNSIPEAGLIQGGQDRGNVLPQPALQLPTGEQEKELARIQSEITAAEHALAGFITASESEFQSWLASEKEFPIPDLAALFHFEETTGATLKNEINPDQPAKTGGNRLAAGRSGNAILADGDSLTQLPDLGIAHADQPFSVSLWLKPAEDHARAVVFANSSSFDLPFSGYELLLENNHVTWTLTRELPGCAVSITTEARIPTGEWTHITVTNDGSRKAAGLAIFLNGRPAATSVASDNLSRDFFIGRALHFMGRGRDFGMRGGMLDDVAIHLRAISAAEAASLHSGKPLSETTDPDLLRGYYFSAVNPSARRLQGNINITRAAYRNVEKNVTEIVTMRETEIPRPAYILERGDYSAIGRKVERETPDWLPPFPEDQPRNRLGFAKWLTSPDHPLTARVTINRIWQEIFGTGIVATSDNFGLQGSPPTHPELLDWLARDFINHGWDYKRAIKQMVLSATYAQDSTTPPGLRVRDPANALLARGPARRLTAEQLRDSALAHAGLLSSRIGGQPAKPYQPEGSMWKALNNFLPEYRHDQGEGLYRRSLYTFWRRTTTPPNMMTFDATTRDVCATNRQTTNTPLQALVLLNDPQFVEAARKLGERIMKEGGPSDEARATWAFREVTGRTTTPAQLANLTAIIIEQREFFKNRSSDAQAFLNIGEAKPDPNLDPIEAATHAALAQALLNLDAHITLR